MSDKYELANLSIIEVEMIREALSHQLRAVGVLLEKVTIDARNQYERHTSAAAAPPSTPAPTDDKLRKAPRIV